MHELLYSDLNFFRFSALILSVMLRSTMGIETNLNAEEPGH